MTTNKPEVVAWLHSVRQDSDVITDKVRHVWGTPRGSMGEYTEPLIRLSDYEALQAEMAELKQTTLFAAGYRFGRDANDAGHTVRLQKEKDALQAECEKLRKDAELYRALRAMHWHSSPLAVVQNPKEAVKPGTYCPSGTQLDEILKEYRSETQNPDET